MFNLFKKKVPEEQLHPFPVPALVEILKVHENEKGSDLTEFEVNELRDKAVCIMMKESAIEEMNESRGYQDINPEYAWQQWQELKKYWQENS